MFAARGPGLSEQGYQPVTLVGDLPAHGVGEWKNPPGWKPQPFWFHRKMGDGSVKGVILELAPPDYVRVGGAKGRRVAPPKNMARTREIPKLVTPNSHAHEMRLVAAGCIPASQMPGEMVDLIVDAYGAGDLPPEVALICRTRMAAVANERARAVAVKAASKKAKPAGTSSKPGTKAAGDAPTRAKVRKR